MTRLPRTPLLAADCVVFDGERRVLLVRRRHEPFQGRWALPGGFIEWGETVEEACRRELSEETGVLVRDLRLVGVYSAPDRDPRAHVCSIAFMAEVGETSTKGGSEVAGLEWWSDCSGLDLAFDHRDILADAVRLARSV